MTYTEGISIANRTKLFTDAKFAAVAAMSASVLPPFTENDRLMLQTPNPEVQTMILFFKPPSKRPGEHSIDFVGDEANFIEKMAFYPWNSDMPFDRSTDTELLRARTRENIQVAVNIIREGCTIYGKKRRTGESTDVHSLRVLIRGNAELKNVGFSQHATLFTSSLARVLHDAQEDFDGFSIQPPDNMVMNDEIAYPYIVSYNNGALKNTYTLALTNKEAKLLQMQLDAVSIPREIKQMDHGEVKTALQINHLLTKTEEIRAHFDEFAAYQTLRIKIDDRTDNVLTYYTNGKENPLEKLRAKLQETIRFFRAVESRAKQYYFKYMSDVREASGRKIFYPQSDAAESIVHFCYYLLMGGTWDEMFAEYLDKAAFGYENLKRQNIESTARYKLLIPSLNPKSEPVTVSPGIF